MKLIEALEILRKAPSADSQRLRINLVCGFMPLHFATFLEAHLRLALPDRRIEITSGLYGDFWGNLERLESAENGVAIVALEWGDLDPRLGLRSLGSWAPTTFPEIIQTVKSRSAQFVRIVQEISKKLRVVISFPTLPLLPVSFSPGWHASAFDVELRVCISNAESQIVGIRNVKVLNSERLDQLSPKANRLDAKSELASGFPYKLGHASVMADLTSQLISSTAPKKGLVTDLDDTLWDGILGEVGVEGISWDLEHGSQVHGLYQRLLQALSEAGVLIAAASKNDARIVDEALGRDDLVLSRDAIFPVDAHWGPKSESFDRILRAWNIGSDSIVFVDDSPLELAEVKASYPDVECVLFPKNDPQAVVALLYRLRDLFGKNALSEEDAVRRDSLRSTQERSSEIQNQGANFDEFLAGTDAEITIDFTKDPLDARALELVNKTNQFNLNARRYDEADWDAYMRQPETFLLMASYKDKYGPLGKIAVLAGRYLEQKVMLDVWVMSCRAFSRRIEYRCLEEVFARYQTDEIQLDFKSTPRNSPIREFLNEIIGHEPTRPCALSRAQFLSLPEKFSPRVLEAHHG